MDKRDFVLFCEKCGFKIDEYQNAIIDMLVDDINNDTLILIVYMPNAAGKTNLSILLSCYFVEKGRLPLLYSPMGMKKDYDCVSIVRNNKELFDRVDCANAGDIFTKRQGKYDYIIADGLAYTDINNVNKTQIAELVECMSQNNIEGVSQLEEKLEWMGQRALSKLSVSSKAKIIIFMKKNDARLCYNTTFLLSSKKHEIDVFPDRLDNDSEMGSVVNTTVEESRVENCLLRQMDRIANSIERIETKVDDISGKINEVYNIIQNVQTKVSSQKDVISSYEDMIDEEFLEVFVEKTVSKLFEQIKDDIKALEGTDAYEKYEQLVKVRMGDDAWGKLEDESKSFLITAKFTFAQNIMFGGQGVDYSSICLLASKAFEIELAKRLIDGYAQYLKDEIGDNYKKWPSAIVKKPKGSPIRPMKTEEFMLGNCPYLFGILETKMKDKVDNKKWFEAYCKARLLKGDMYVNLQTAIKELDTYIQTIKDRFRNPAAHKDKIGLIEASECIDYVLEIERVLKSILELFVF